MTLIKGRSIKPMSKRVLTAFLKSVETGAFPRAQKAVWKWWYQKMASKWRSKDWVFMNYGYLSINDTPPFKLDDPDEQDRCTIGQYHHAVCDVEIAGKHVLEIGSGRGGGASYIARYFKPEKMVGLDFSSSAVDLSQHIHQGINNLSFVEGDAENLPFEDASFDVIVNVESSHCYGNMAAFVAEVERVLKPGGCFVWSDFRKANTGEQTQTEQVFQRPGLKPIHQEDITPNVVKALDSTNDQKLAMISSMPLFKKIFREFAGTKGSAIYNAMKSGEVVYMSKRFEKARA